MTIYSLDVLLSYLEPVCCSMSSSNCCFLTCIQISQESGQVVWYSHLFKNFPQFVVIDTVQRFGIVNKTEVDIFLNYLAFSMIQQMMAIWSLVPLPFLNPAWTSEVHSSRTTEAWLGEFWLNPSANLLCLSPTSIWIPLLIYPPHYSTWTYFF